MRIRFGPFAFDPDSRLLWRDGAEIALPPRVLAVLEVLLDRAGEVVARQDLLDRAWKDAFVTDTSLAEAVSFLRQALGDDPQSPRYIQTVHRRGYRFLPTPTRVPPASDPGLTPVEAGSNRGQTGVRPGSDPFRLISAQAVGEPGTGLPVAATATVDWQLVPWSAAALCAGLALAAVWHSATAKTPEPAPVSRFELRAPTGTAFDRASQPIAIAPDGRTLAWSGCELASGRCAIYLRAIDRLEARPLPGSEGGHSPLFSPDGRWIAFFADGALKKIAAGGGAATTLASAPEPAGAAWIPDGHIVFAGSAASGLSLIDDQGGAVQPLTEPIGERGELRHAHPASIATTNALALTIASDPDADAAGSLAFLAPDTPGVRTVRTGVHNVVPAGRAYLLLASGTDLQAATFDERTLTLTGATDALPAPPGDGVPQFAVGGNVLALLRPPAPALRLWSDGASASAVARFTSIAISPDSRRAAGVIGDHNASDIWVADLISGATTRLTFSGTNVSPVWSADSQRVLYAARAGAAPFRVFSRPASDAADTSTLVPSVPPQSFPTSTTADGRVALTRYKNRHTAVIVIDASGAAPRVLSDGPYDEGAAALSPDGRWVALESTASGRTDVIVRATADGRRIAVLSTEGGRRPRWSADGRAIFFTSGRRVLKAAFTGGESAGRLDAVLDRAGDRALAIAPSGRMLIERQPDPDSAVIVLQWLRELRERLPLPVNTPR